MPAPTLFLGHQVNTLEAPTCYQIQTLNLPFLCSPIERLRQRLYAHMERASTPNPKFVKQLGALNLAMQKADQWSSDILRSGLFKLRKSSYHAHFLARVLPYWRGSPDVICGDLLEAEKMAFALSHTNTVCAERFNKFVSNVHYTSTQMIKMLNWAASRHHFAYHHATRRRRRTPKTPVHSSSHSQLLEV